MVLSSVLSRRAKVCIIISRTALSETAHFQMAENKAKKCESRSQPEEILCSTTDTFRSIDLQTVS